VIQSSRWCRGFIMPIRSLQLHQEPLLFAVV
jgi:hypothetical protein